MFDGVANRGVPVGSLAVDEQSLPIRLTEIDALEESRLSIDPSKLSRGCASHESDTPIEPEHNRYSRIHADRSVRRDYGQRNLGRARTDASGLLGGPLVVLSDVASRHRCVAARVNWLA